MKQADQVWRDFAMCREVDPELYFPEGNEDVVRMQARRICEGCPVRAECLVESVVFRAEEGVWGGMPGYIREKRAFTRILPSMSREEMLAEAEFVIAEFDQDYGTAAEFFEKRRHANRDRYRRRRDRERAEEAASCVA